MSKAVIFGGRGQLGYYMSKMLFDKGYEVVCPEIDIVNYSEVAQCLHTHKPEEIYNFAGMSSVSDCENLPLSAIKINTLGVANILEGAREYCNDPIVFQAGSHKELIIDDLYSLTKSMSTSLTSYYKSKYNMKAFCGMLPHCESPKRTSKFFVGKVLRWLDGLKKSMHENNISSSDFDFSSDEILVIQYNEVVWRYPKIRLGNLYSKSYWMTAQDAASMIYYYVHNNESGTFFLHRDIKLTPADILEKIINKAGLKHDWSKYYVFDQSFFSKKTPIQMKKPVKYSLPGDVDNFINFITL